MKARDAMFLAFLSAAVAAGGAVAMAAQDGDDNAGGARPQAPQAAKPATPPDRRADRGRQHPPAVITPPATGDEDVLKPPQSGTVDPMPVIPPPGSPGGNERVEPK